VIPRLVVRSSVPQSFGTENSQSGSEPRQSGGLTVLHL
jgi:hypothetical protein